MTVSKSTWRFEILVMVALLAAAFLGAGSLQDSGMLSLIPPDATMPDAEGKEFSLYASAFTAWAALILLVPAYVFVWFRTHYDRWLAFWGVSYAAYLVHLYVSAFWFFEGDFTAMTTSSRVSAFWPGMVIAVWWGVDVVIGLSKAHAKWVTVQRVIVHLLVFVLFVGGSAVKGETALIQLMGWALFGAGIGALVVAFLNKRKLA